MESVDLVSRQGGHYVVHIPFQKGIGDWYVDSAHSFTLSMTSRLATVTYTEELMAVPNVCFKNSPLNARFIASRQNWRSCTTCSAESAVCSDNELTALSLSLATLTARSAGAFVKTDTTSNDASIISLLRV